MTYTEFIIELKCLMYRMSLLKHGIHNNSITGTVRVNDGKNRVTIYVNQKYIVRYDKRNKLYKYNDIITDNAVNILNCLIPLL